MAGVRRVSEPVFERVEPQPAREGLVWNGEDLVPTLIVDDGRRFVGWEPRQCGEHRTVGNYRAWCFDCSEWCYPDFDMACARCRLARYEP